MIAMATAGAGRVRRLLLGSVAERVLHLARRSVLVVSHSTQRVPAFEASAAAIAGA